MSTHATLASGVERCGSCGEDISSGARFCPACGAPSARSSSSGVTRRLELAALKERLFGDRPWADLAIYAAIGGVTACLCSWIVLWLLLHLVGNRLGLPLPQLARLGLPLVLGAPLNGSVHASFLSAHAQFRLPLTVFVLVPAAALLAGGYVAARAFGPRVGREAGLIGSLGGAVFAMLTVLGSASLGGHASVPALGVGGISIGGYSESMSLSPDRLQTFVYGLAFGLPFGALGGAIYAYGFRRILDVPLRRYQPKSDIHAVIFAAAYAALRTFRVIVPICIGFGVLAYFRSSVPFFAAPSLAIGGVFLGQGIGYDIRGSVGTVFGAFRSHHSTIHFWSDPRGVVALLVTALLAYMLVDSVRTALRRATRTSLLPPAVLGAAVAIPWVGLLIVLRGWGSASVVASGLSIFTGSGSVAPDFTQTVLFGSIFAAACGGFAGASLPAVAAVAAPATDGAPPSPGHVSASPSQAATERVVVSFEDTPRPTGRVMLRTCEQCGALVSHAGEMCEACGAVSGG